MTVVKYLSLFQPETEKKKEEVEKDWLVISN